ncbi:M16 family metallopeptidase [Thermodesulfobacteriota bacterium]
MNHKTTLTNGVRIVTERLEHYRSVSLGLWVDVGSRHEAEQENGISHFIEHMIFKGTQKRTNFQIAKELDAIGGFSNAFTGKENTCFHSKVLDNHFFDLSEILSDIFLNSVFAPQEMDLERQVIVQEINMVEDTPDEFVHHLFNHLFWTHHPLGMPVLGTGETVSAISKQTILDYMRKFYTPDRIIIAAAGNVHHEEIVTFFRPLFESIEANIHDAQGGVPQINAEVLCHHRDLEQVHLCLGGRGPHLSSDRRYASAILSTLLGGNMSSRLYQEIREKRGLAYSIYSFLSAYTDTGLLGVYLATDPSKVNQVLGVINAEIKKIQMGDISQSDLTAIREHLIGGIILGSENTDSRMMRLAKNEFIFDRYLSYEELIADLERVTLDDVIAVAGEVFQEENVSLTALGAIDRKDLDLGSLQFANN